MVSKTLIRLPQGTELRAASRLTGRYIMAFTPGAHDDVTARLGRNGIPAVRSKPLNVKTAHPLPHGSHYILPTLGFAVIDPHSEKEDALFEIAAADDNIQHLIPEGSVEAAGMQPSFDYVRGWRDATDALAGQFVEPSSPELEALSAGHDEYTWGLTATGVPATRFTGAGIKLAVLDTGLDLSHPDFAGRAIISENLVGDGMPFHDGKGHGTHCCGTAAGPLHPKKMPRYGIAYDSPLYVGRVLDDQGFGVQGTLLQGIDRAVQLGYAVISMSIGSPWAAGQPAYDVAYETACQRALHKGCLMVIAAGNEGSAVGQPGNSPSALTVAAVDRTLATAAFSNRAIPGAPGVKAPDCAAPGVGVYSSWLVSAGSYRIDDGTSMATPHVAGIAALFAQSDPKLRGQALKDAVIAHCRPLANGAARRGEIGAGLVRAP